MTNGDSKLHRAYQKTNFMGVAGTFLVLEAVASMLWSQDKQPISQLGRVVRAGIGVAILTVKVCG